ncbi:Alpha/Beta hydrolase protein [Mycena floridula]|nr:Alpha/Beta hydrolase protein [Mycena floridula]
MSESHSHLSILDPEVAEIIAHMPKSEPLTDVQDVQARRDAFNGAVVSVRAHQEAYLPPDSEYSVTEHTFQLDDKVQIPARCLKPNSSSEEQEFPLLFWVHGGGFFTGSMDLGDFYFRRLCVDLQIVIIQFDYRLAPEHPSPTGLNDSYATLKWAANSAKLFGASLQQGFILAGESAGAHYAATMAHRALDDPFFKANPITGQHLSIPTLIHPEAYPDQYKDSLRSLVENKDSLFVGADAVHSTYEYLGGSPTDPEVSPLLFPSLKGLPPTYLQVCGQDPFRDEGLLYERLLREQGVSTKIDIYPGVQHGFHYFFPKVKQAVKYDQDFRQGILWLLQQV